MGRAEGKEEEVMREKEEEISEYDAEEGRWMLYLSAKSLSTAWLIVLSTEAPYLKIGLL